MNVQQPLTPDKVHPRVLKDLVDVTAKPLGNQERFLVTGKGQVLLNVFISHLDDRMECSFGKSVDEIKLGGVVSAPLMPGGAGEMADRSILKFNRGHCGVP